MIKPRCNTKTTVTYTEQSDAMAAVYNRLRCFEQQYDMDSETFYDRYNNGQMPDDSDFVEWANDYQHYLAFQLQQVVIEGPPPLVHTFCSVNVAQGERGGFKVIPDGRESQ